MGILAGYRLLVGQYMYFFQLISDIISLFPGIFYLLKVSFTVTPLKIMFSFSWECLYGISLNFWIRVVWLWCTHLRFFLYLPCLGVDGLHKLTYFISFKAFICRNIAILFLFHSKNSHYTYIRTFKHIFSYLLCSVLFFSFFFSSSLYLVWIFSIDLLLSLLSSFSAVFNLLLNASNGFLLSVICVFLVLAYLFLSKSSLSISWLFISFPLFYLIYLK